MHHAQQKTIPELETERNRRQGTTACPTPTQTVATWKPPQLLRERRPPQTNAPLHHTRRGYRKRGATDKGFDRNWVLLLYGKSVCPAGVQKPTHVHRQCLQRHPAERKGWFIALYHFRVTQIKPHIHISYDLVGFIPCGWADETGNGLTEAMPFLWKLILLSYAPDHPRRGLFPVLTILI